VEVLGAMRGIKNCLAEEFNNVSLQTDSKFVEQLIHNDNFFREACSKKKIDKHTKDCISLSRAVLQKTLWPLGYVRHQVNMTANFLAKYARILKQIHWPDSRDYEHLQDVHMNDVKIYITNDIHVG
jgi:ribonuclease HI